eukprot:TRINITY_DN23424_c0_g1_i1.p1 TRINITY_DN23424_c0_g1~~TRINITY_DN23424_c0_g1_i1.p1  ORF type:complete len:665 (-),score=115.19 TRINITY_DN23424_c0_g1_i1:47-2041(-)
MGVTRTAASLGLALGTLGGRVAPGQTFVHLFEWSWDDIARECEQWLGPKGFSAVQISPPNEHARGDSWNVRYQPVSYTLESRSGTQVQFEAMVGRCKAVGVGIYADVVINQMAPGSGTGFAGSPFGNRTYPPLYSAEDFHHFPDTATMNCGVNNYQNKTNIQYCDLLGMPDVCTGCPTVQAKIAAYIARMQDLGIAGFRVDAAKHMNANELRDILSNVDHDLYRFLEVLKEPDEAVQPPEYFDLGQITEIGFGSTLGNKFKKTGLLWPDMEKLGASWGLMDSEKAIVFLDNHDTQRSTAGITYKDGAVYTMANVFMLAWPYGYPKVMSSFKFETKDQGPPSIPVHGQDGGVHCGVNASWVCEHRWTAIANMVAWRKQAADAPVTMFKVGDGDTYGNVLSFCRGSVACVAFNRDEQTPWDAVVEVSMPEGVYCNVAESDDRNCSNVAVLSGGQVHLTVPPLGVVAFHVGKRASDSSRGSHATGGADDSSEQSVSDSSRASHAGGIDDTSTWPPADDRSVARSSDSDSLLDTEHSERHRAGLDLTTGLLQVNASSGYQAHLKAAELAKRTRDALRAEMEEAKRFLEELAPQYHAAEQHLTRLLSRGPWARMAHDAEEHEDQRDERLNAYFAKIAMLEGRLAELKENLVEQGRLAVAKENLTLHDRI